MANGLYDPWKVQLLQGGANSSLAGTVKQTYVDITSAYVFAASHAFVTSIATYDAPTYGAAATLTNKTFVNGVFDADDTLTAAFFDADDMGAIVLYVDGATEAASRLVLYLDTGVTGLPFTPQSVDMTVKWDAAGIFKL